MVIEVQGRFVPTLWDTLTGKISSVNYKILNGRTIIEIKCQALDSVLLLLKPTIEESNYDCKKELSANGTEIYIPNQVEFQTTEPNVLVLDMCKWSLDGEVYFEKEEMLRIDKRIREKFHYPLADGEGIQPWCLPKNNPKIFPYLEFYIDCREEIFGRLCFEELSALWINNEKISFKNDGYYVDKSIHMTNEIKLKEGMNKLVVQVPISERISLENLFFIGNFNVMVADDKAWLTKKSKYIEFGSIIGQGFPFYGGVISYNINFYCNKGNLKIELDEYIGAVIDVYMDGNEVGMIAFPPYMLCVKNISEGKHKLSFKLYATRINTFGALHLSKNIFWKGPNMWYTKDDEWSYKYCLKDLGIIKKPKITLID